jgi:hypothetical protein
MALHRLVFIWLLISSGAIVRSEPAPALELEVTVPFEVAPERETRRTPKFEAQSWPALAAGNDQFLVIWGERAAGSGVNMELHGARIGKFGELLDKAAIVIVSGANPSAPPSVASDGERFLVAWQMNQMVDAEVWGVFIETDGQVGTPFLVSAAAKVNEPPAVASVGGKFVVIWVGASAGTGNAQVKGTAITAQGTVGPTFDVGDTTGEQSQPAIGANAGVLLVSYMQNGNIVGARLDAAGVVLGGERFMIGNSGATVSPKVGGFGNDFMVVWEDLRNGNYDVYGARVTTNGTVLNPEGIAIARTSDPEGQPSVCGTDQGAVVVWEAAQFRGVRMGVFIGVDGTVQAPVMRFNNGERLGVSAPLPSVARIDERFLVAWNEGYAFDNSHEDIMGVFFSADRVVDPSFPLSVGPTQIFHSTAFDGVDFFSAWLEGPATFNDPLYDSAGTRISPVGIVEHPAGRVLEGNAILHGVAGRDGEALMLFLAEAPHPAVDGEELILGTINHEHNLILKAGRPELRRTHGIYAPNISAASDSYLVTYITPGGSDRALWGVQFTNYAAWTEGRLTNFLIAAPMFGGKATAASVNGDYFVVWPDGREIWGTLVRSKTSTANPPIRISNSKASPTPTWGLADFPEITANKTEYFVVWEDRRNAGTTGADIYGMKISADGLPIGGEFPVSAGPENEGTPLVASNGEDYLLAFTRSPQGANGSESGVPGALVCQAISADGRSKSAARVVAGRVPKGKIARLTFGSGKFLLTSEYMEADSGLSGSFLSLRNGSITLRTPRRVEGGMEISWFSMVGQNYTLEKTGTLDQVNWIAVGDPVSGTGEVIRRTVVENAQSYFRLKVQD